MFEYLPFDDITEEHLVMIAESLLAAPEAQRPAEEDILRGLFTGVLVAFTIPEGLIIVSTDNKRLRIDCFTGRIFDRKELAADLRRLAADWECDTIETLAFDPRLAAAIKRIGGLVESQTLTLAV